MATAWRRPDGHTQVMLVDYRPGTARVLGRVAELVERWGGQVLVDVPSRGLIPTAVEPPLSEQAMTHNALFDAATRRNGASRERNGVDRRCPRLPLAPVR